MSRVHYTAFVPKTVQVGPHEVLEVVRLKPPYSFAEPVGQPHLDLSIQNSAHMGLPFFRPARRYEALLDLGKGWRQLRGTVDFLYEIKALAQQCRHSDVELLRFADFCRRNERRTVNFFDALEKAASLGPHTDEYFLLDALASYDVYRAKVHLLNVRTTKDKVQIVKETLRIALGFPDPPMHEPNDSIGVVKARSRFRERALEYGRELAASVLVDQIREIGLGIDVDREVERMTDDALLWVRKLRKVASKPATADPSFFDIYTRAVIREMVEEADQTKLFPAIDSLANVMLDDPHAFYALHLFSREIMVFYDDDDSFHAFNYIHNLDGDSLARFIEENPHILGTMLKLYDDDAYNSVGPALKRVNAHRLAAELSGPDLKALMRELSLAGNESAERWLEDEQAAGSETSADVLPFKPPS